MKRTKQQKLPTGWTEERIRKLAEHYDHQSEDEQAAEIEASLHADNITMMAVPTALVPQVLRIIHRPNRTA